MKTVLYKTLVLFELVLFFVEEINPGCTNITCQNGGSCLYINETHNAECVCRYGFQGQVCEGKNSRVSRMKMRYLRCFSFEVSVSVLSSQNDMHTHIMQ